MTVELFICEGGWCLCDCLFFCFELYGSSLSSFQHSAVIRVLIGFCSGFLVRFSIFKFYI